MAARNERGEVRAGGGVIFRSGRAGPEVLAVHRPSYGDWSLPKGKADPGEDDLAAALREVREETGLDCVAGKELPAVRYVDGRGRPKVVRYWLMTAREGAFAPHDEVDDIRWVPVNDVASVLTYPRDVETVRHAAAALPLQSRGPQTLRKGFDRRR